MRITAQAAWLFDDVVAGRGAITCASSSGTGVATCLANGAIEVAERAVKPISAAGICSGESIDGTNRVNPGREGEKGLKLRSSTRPGSRLLKLLPLQGGIGTGLAARRAAQLTHFVVGIARGHQTCYLRKRCAMVLYSMKNLDRVSCGLREVRTEARVTK